MVDRKWPHIERLIYVGVALVVMVMLFFLAAFGKVTVAWIMGSMGGIFIFVLGFLLSQRATERAMQNSIGLLEGQAQASAGSHKVIAELYKNERAHAMLARDGMKQLSAQQTGQEAGVASWEVRAQENAHSGGPRYLE